MLKYADTPPTAAMIVASQLHAIAPATSNTADTTNSGSATGTNARPMTLEPAKPSPAKMLAAAPGSMAAIAPQPDRAPTAPNARRTRAKIRAIPKRLVGSGACDDGTGVIEIGDPGRSERCATPRRRVRRRARGAGALCGIYFRPDFEGLWVSALPAALFAALLADFDWRVLDADDPAALLVTPDDLV